MAEVGATMRVLRYGEFVLAIIGVLAMIGGWRLGLPPVLHGGLVVFGSAVVLDGFATIMTREAFFRRNEYYRTSYYGLAGALWGLPTIVGGIGFIAVGLVLAQRLEDVVFAYILDRPGPVLVAGGLAFFGAGGAIVLGAREWQQSLGAFLLSLPDRFGGLIFLAIGLGALGIGLFELMSPSAFDAALASIVGPLP